jgi:hypothetical protein
MTTHHKLKKLLEQTNEAYYWLGFILADGHFESRGRLTIHLAEKDIEHIYRLVEFLGVDCKISKRVLKDRNYFGFSVMDSETYKQLKSRFDIHNNKTINPPNLSSIKGDHLFSTMVGFLDGDGCIRNQLNREDHVLTVKCHSSWCDNLSYLFGKSSRLNNQGYSHLNISDNTTLREIKIKAISLGLPFMERKLGKIDTSKVSRYVTSRNRLVIANKLKEEGKSYSEIAQILNVNYSAIYALMTRTKKRNKQ